MGLNFSKKMIVGVSVTPDIGIEVAQIDYEKRILKNYVSKPFQFDTRLQGNFDLDIFKETLYDALVEAGIPQGSEIVLNVPACLFEVKDWPASLEKVQVVSAIESEVYESPIFRDSADEVIYSYAHLPNSTVQFNKFVYTAAPKSIVMEMAVQIRDLNYKLVAIDTSVNSTLNALIYSGRVDVSANMSWVMLLVENNCCRLISMLGRSYVDYKEEKISIGKVLEESENYEIVVNAVSSLLGRMPSSLLYVISKTDIISAEALASKLSYGAPIVHQEVNSYNQTPFIDLAFDLDPQKCSLASLDIIGAAIKKNFGSNSLAPLNLFNEMLGDVYYSQTNPVFAGIELSVGNMFKFGVVFALILFGFVLAGVYTLNNGRAEKEARLSKLDSDIASITQYLKEHEDISTQAFSEIDEIKIGLTGNKNIYSYYTIVGTEIPKKLWLTSLSLGKNVSIEGQADNLESVYGFFRNIKDYDPSSPVKLQKLGLAGKSGGTGFSEVEGADFDTESILTTLNADFYEFVISDVEPSSQKKDSGNNGGNDSNEGALPNLEPLE